MCVLQHFLKLIRAKEIQVFEKPFIKSVICMTVLQLDSVYFSFLLIDMFLF